MTGFGSTLPKVHGLHCGHFVVGIFSYSEKIQVDLAVLQTPPGRVDLEPGVNKL